MSPNAGEWIHVYRALFDHPKSKRLAKRLGIDVPAAVGYLICLWTWCLAIAPDGDLSRFEAEDIEAASGWGGEDGVFVTEATACRWLDTVKGGVVVHDWDDWAGTMVAKRAKERKRSADRRAAAREPEVDTPPTEGRTTVDRSTTSGRPLAEETDRQRREKREKDQEPPLPPKAVPQPVDNSEEQDRGWSIDQDNPADATSAPDSSDKAASDAAGTCGVELPAGVSDVLAGIARGAVTPELREAAARMLGRVDELAGAQFAHLSPDDQAGNRDRCRLAAFERIADRDRQKRIANLPAYIRVAVKRSTHLGDLVGDELVEELRAVRRSKRDGQPKPLADCLPPAFAQPMPRTAPAESEAS